MGHEESPDAHIFTPMDLKRQTQLHLCWVPHCQLNKQGSNGRGELGLNWFSISGETQIIATVKFWGEELCILHSELLKTQSFAC